MSWLEDELRKQREQGEERRRQEEERRRQEAIEYRRLEQEHQMEEAIRNQHQQQRQQQFDQMARQRLEPIISSLQLRQLLQDTERSWPSIYDSAVLRFGKGSKLGTKKSSLREDFHGEGNVSMRNEPLRLTGWEYSVWLTLSYLVLYSDSSQGYDTESEWSHTIRFRLWGDALTQTRIVVEEKYLSGSYWEEKTTSWEETITPSNTSRIVTQLKNTIVQAINRLEVSISEW